MTLFSGYVSVITLLEITTNLLFKGGILRLASKKPRSIMRGGQFCFVMNSNVF